MTKLAMDEVRLLVVRERQLLLAVLLTVLLPVLIGVVAYIVLQGVATPGVRTFARVLNLALSLWMVVQFALFVLVAKLQAAWAYVVGVAVLGAVGLGLFSLILIALVINLVNKRELTPRGIRVGLTGPIL